MSDHLACFRTPDHLRALFGIAGAVPNWPPSWNVGRGARTPAVCRYEGARSLRLLRWGFVRDAMRDAVGDVAPLHARAETVTSSHLFADAFRDNRCLVPADAFYLRASGNGGTPVAAARMDGRPAALGGIWSDDDAAGEIAGSFAILTLERQFNAVSPDRMPVLIEESDWGTWLGEDAGEVMSLLRPTAAALLRAWPVGAGIDDPGRDGPDLLDPLD